MKVYKIGVCNNFLIRTKSKDFQSHWSGVNGLWTLNITGMNLVLYITIECSLTLNVLYCVLYPLWWPNFHSHNFTAVGQIHCFSIRIAQYLPTLLGTSAIISTTVKVWLFVDYICWWIFGYECTSADIYSIHIPFCITTSLTWKAMPV